MLPPQYDPQSPAATGYPWWNRPAQAPGWYQCNLCRRPQCPYGHSPGSLFRHLELWAGIWWTTPTCTYHHSPSDWGQLNTPPPPEQRHSELNSYPAEGLWSFVCWSQTALQKLVSKTQPEDMMMIYLDYWNSLFTISRNQPTEFDFFQRELENICFIIDLQTLFLLKSLSVCASPSRRHPSNLLVVWSVHQTLLWKHGAGVGGAFTVTAPLIFKLILKTFN